MKITGVNVCEMCVNLLDSHCEYGNNCVPIKGGLPTHYKSRQNCNAVDHPSHYNQGGIECIDALKACMSEEAFKGFLKGNVIKYMWRYEDKGKALEDCKKAEWYLGRLILELLEE